MSDDRPYVLGHAGRELDRLDLQGLIYRDATLRAIDAAGIVAGMRVLDLGCGSGDVTRLVAGVVGPDGSVVGVDRDEATVDAARKRTQTEGPANASFEVADAGAENTALDSNTGTFDALICRFLLMHQDDPAAVLAGAARAVRPGGPIVAIESNMASLRDGEHSRPHSSLYDSVVRWKCGVVGGAGADLESGLRLWQTFRDAGLPGPTLHLEAPIEGGSDSLVYRYMAESVRSMLPRAGELGVVDADLGPVDTLEERLREEVVAADGVLVCWPVVAAWSHVPAD